MGGTHQSSAANRRARNTHRPPEASLLPTSSARLELGAKAPAEQQRAVSPGHQPSHEDASVALAPGPSAVPASAAAMALVESAGHMLAPVAERLSKEAAYYQDRIDKHGPFATRTRTVRYAGDGISESADIRDPASIEDLVTRIIERSGGQRGIKRLRLSSHGRAGLLLMDGDATRISSAWDNYPEVLAQFARLKPFMAMEGRITLSACIVARGVQGERLLHDLAQATGVPVTGYTGTVEMGTDETVGVARTRHPGQRWDAAEAVISQVHAEVRSRTAGNTITDHATWMQRAVECLRLSRRTLEGLDGGDAWTSVVDTLEEDGSLALIRQGLEMMDPSHRPKGADIWSHGINAYNALGLPGTPLKPATDLRRKLELAAALGIDLSPV